SIHPFSSGQTSFSDGDLLALATSERQVWPSPGTMALFYLYLTGGYAPDSSVLGLTFRGSAIAVFEGTIAQDAPSGSAAAVTATVLVHEFGHELGLVGIIGYAPNEDPAHPYHSNDPNDVMYWSVDSTAMLLGLLGGAAPSTQFDAADLSDLATVRSTWIPLEVLPWIVLAGILTAALILAVSYRRAGRRTKSAGEPSLPAAPTK
ncbi:MAG: hypothetical protein L3J91_01485, partial [Thermoplasmata archaeon]|nr:hypothetical protein [Thermoplasmata archaeon]